MKRVLISAIAVLLTMGPSYSTAEAASLQNQITTPAARPIHKIDVKPKQTDTKKIEVVEPNRNSKPGSVKIDQVKRPVIVPPVKAKPDLQLVSVRADRTRVNTGDPIAVTAQIQNTGTEALQNVTVQFSYEGSPQGRPYRITVPAGQPVPLRTMITAGAPGQKIIAVEVDPIGAIAETDETNNRRQITITVNAPMMSPAQLRRPDIGKTAPTGLSSIGKAAVPGKMNVALGAGPTAPSASVKGTIAGSAAVAGAPKTNPHVSPAGAEKLAVIDSLRPVTLHDKIALNLPDLAAMQLVMDTGNEPLLIGTRHEVKFLVKNIGTKQSPPSSAHIKIKNISTYSSCPWAFIVNFNDIPELAPGQTHWLSTEFDVTEGMRGQISVWTELDIEKAIIESDEQNNEFHQFFFVISVDDVLAVEGSPESNFDLVVTGASIGSADHQLVVGESYPISATIRNDGTETTPPAQVTFTFWPTNGGHRTIKSFALPSLNHQQTHTINSFFIPEAHLLGNMGMHVEADANQLIVEKNEKNNDIIVGGWSVLPHPPAAGDDQSPYDLEVTELIVEMPEPYAVVGDTSTVIIKMTNKGTMALPQTTGRLEMAFRTDELHQFQTMHESSFSLPALQPGEMREIVTKVALDTQQKGSLLFIASADIDDQVPESDENNNIRARASSVYRSANQDDTQGTMELAYDRVKVQNRMIPAVRKEQFSLINICQDLLIETIEVHGGPSDSYIITGSPYTFVVTVKNASVLTSPPVKAKIQIDAATGTVMEFSIPPLLAGTTHQISKPYIAPITFAGGTLKITARVDTANTLEECNESNNLQEKYLPVQSADQSY